MEKGLLFLRETSFISLQFLVYEIFAFEIFTPVRKFANTAPDHTIMFL